MNFCPDDEVIACHQALSDSQTARSDSQTDRKTGRQIDWQTNLAVAKSSARQLAKQTTALDAASCACWLEV